MTEIEESIELANKVLKQYHHESIIEWLENLENRVRLLECQKKR